MANSVDPDQTASSLCSQSVLGPYCLLLYLIGNYLQQTTSADKLFRCIFFLGVLRVKG